MRLLKWCRDQHWTYLGYTELEYTSTNRVTQVVSEKGKRFVHFYCWEANNKKRKVKYLYPGESRLFTQSAWYQTKVVPWLAGGDIWKPIEIAVAVKGNLINYLGK